MLFADLPLSEPILRAVASEGYTLATPIQAQAIPHVLEGRDVLGSAQTGTGKTAAFALPILQKLSQTPRPTTRGARCLVLCPTRELASQIADGFKAYGKHVNVRHTVIYGGVGQRPQTDALRNGVDVIIATPGRLLDLFEQGHVDLRGVDTLVLDEADRMLDMGFIHDIRRITAQLKKERQTLMFSATMPSEIKQLVASLLKNPISIAIVPVSTATNNVSQKVYHVEKKNKHFLLAHLYNELPMARTIVFSRTKHGADKIVRHLHVHGIKAEAIHGNKSQNARQRALDNFKRGKTPMLIATDIAARGIDVDNITHVVNYDLTHEPETYVHRIGRTARAGASGAAVSFVDRDEMSNLRAIERLLKTRLDVVAEHPTYPASSAAAYKDDDREERGGEREGRQQHFGRSVPQGQGKPSRGQGGGAGKRSSAPARAERPQADRGSDRGGDRSHARGTDRGDRNGDRSNAGFARSAERPQAPRVASGDRPIARPVTSSSDRSAPQHPLNAQRGQRPAPAGASRQKRRF